MRKHNRLTSLFLMVFFLLGIGLLLYPTVSDYYNSLHQSRVIRTYDDTIQNTENDILTEARDAARQYNAGLLGRNNTRYTPTAAQHELYQSLLDLSGVGAMGYIEVPRANVQLTLYHGTGPEALATGVGHIEGSSLPVGGTGTHCVLSGHRGLPSARLFTDLDQVQEGDLFFLHVLDETLAYQVDQIKIVEPGDISDLALDPQADLCTLITCTPYGINSHRLLVRGHRVEYQEALVLHVTAEVTLLSSLYLLPIMAAPMLLFLLALLLLWPAQPPPTDYRR